MAKIYFNIISTFRYLVFFLVLSVIGNSVLAAECYEAEDMGTGLNVEVPSNPSGTYGNGYVHNTLSQRAPWIDANVYTDGNPNGFVFEVKGKWRPWLQDDERKNKTPHEEAFESCVLKTENQDSTSTGIKGEFDYITSTYKVQSQTMSYTKTSLPPNIQRSCVLTAGEGLYIAFFGKSGYQLPEIATHVKIATIKCDPPFNNDKNADGIFTANECYDPNNPAVSKLYYFPYRSEHLLGSVSCSEEFFHGSNINKIGITDCFEEVKQDDGTKLRVDRTRFLFSAPYLFNKQDKSRVRKGEKVKFIIFDTFYKDNLGEYNITMYTGVSDMKDPGLIEKILRDLEAIFVGERDEYGVTQGGILKQFYSYIIKDNMFANFVRLSIIFYIMFLGLQFAMGSLQYTTKELMRILLKLTFVLGFTSVKSWHFYDSFVIRFFLDGFSDVVVIFANIAQRIFDPETDPLIVGGSISNKFAFIDQACLYLFSDVVTRKIQGLFFGVWFGFLVIPIFYGLACYYAFQLVNAVFPYIIMLIQAVLALAIGPIFISFYLFKTTEHLFKNWLAFVGGRFANMAFLFLFLFAFDAIIKKQFEDLLHFKVCKVPLFQAISDSDGTVDKTMDFFSFGLKVWDAVWNNNYPKPNFLGFCIDLLFIGVLIYLFGVIMKKVPTIIDSMISIDGESGGGLDKSGNSKFGKDIQTLTGALDSSIKVTGADGKEVGIATGLNNYLKDNTKKGFKALGKGIWKGTGGAAIDAIKNKTSADDAKVSALDAGLKGKEAVDAATKRFEDSLAARGISGSELQSKRDSFRKEAEKEFIKEPINNEMQKISSDLQNLSKKSGSQLSANTIEKLTKERMEGFVGKTFGGDSKQYAKYYENSGMMKSMKFGADGNAHDLNDVEYEKMKRQFNVQESNSRLGLSGSNISDYQKSVKNQLNAKKSVDPDIKKNSKKYMGANDLDLSNKKFKETIDREQKELLEKNLESMKREATLLKAQERDMLKEKSRLLNEMDQARKMQEKANIDKELQRLKDMNNLAEQNANLNKNKNALEQIANLNRRKEENQKIEQLRSEKEKAIREGNINKEKELVGQLKDIQKNRIGYDELLEKSKSLDGESYLKDSSLVTPYEEKFKQVSDKEKEVTENINKLIEEASATKNIVKDQVGNYDFDKNQGNVNLVLSGIDNQTFGVQGIKGLGLGEDNKDLIGFGKGAGAAILGADFQGNADDKSTVDQNNNNMLKTRLRLVKQESKFLEFQLAQAKNEGNENNIKGLEEQLKDAKKQIRIISDDIES